MDKKNRHSEGSVKAPPSDTHKAARGAVGEMLHPTHPVRVTLSADHTAEDVITGYPEFLNRLAQDDAFRDQLLRDPDRVLEAYGVKFDPPLTNAFGSNKIQLPPKAKVQEFLDALHKAAPSFMIGHFNLVHDFWKVITTGGRK